MRLLKSGEAASRFSAYVDGLRSAIGHADRARPLRDYCMGLMMPCERKSVEPMAAITAPERTAAQHQSLLHFVGEGNWSDEKVLAKVREMVLPEMERHGPIEVWIIDDTGFPKKGRHSVGVGRQYCGELGKQDNCQIAVTLSIANHHASLPAAYRLYLPKEWATDRPRRRKAGVPKEVTFKTKPAIALDHLRWACAADLPRGVVLMDAGYGARRRRCADQILVLNASGEHRVRSTRRYCQTALAHRTRLPGTQTGGWPRPLRRARMARLPSSRNAMHRGLWIPDLRAGDDSPLRNSFPPVVHGNYNSRNLSAQRVRHCGLSATSRIPSRLSDGD